MMPRQDFSHFTGKRAGKRVRHKSRRAKNHHSHVNKYASLVPRKKLRYDAKDKRIRQLPLRGMPGEVKCAGLIALFHGRRYRLTKDVIIPLSREAFGRFKMF